jgi:beta-galactosidase
LDRDWRFYQGSASGAEQSSFADSSWRALNVPHDWSIEGPFSQTAPTTGRGGYVPAGVAWYRKHFTLPQNLSGRKVYIEFDGVMENSSVYINGVQLGNHPYGYASFRYDMTANVKFGTTDNVLAVKADTSLQPNSRYYAGSGIYRHVRIIATNPVHIDQWATQVTTPQPTASAATVHVVTTVVNSGTTAATVGVQGVVTDPSGTALAPVTTPTQSVAAGASASFSFEVAVSSPKLWSPDSPSLYRLATKVQVGGTAVDDDVTTFGIRSLAYDATTGLTINGVATKFKGACLHQDYHGLGVAAPQRAMQRRLAQLKTYGVNAVRTAHDPPSPEFLDLCDRMGILVMDEFFDVWTGHKYTDVGDYATYFNKTASTPTGTPAVPGAATGAKWYEVDVTGIVMRDRNHPSVVLYSAGNEIRDSLATRTPLLTRMIAIVRALDSTRPVTQALFRPLDSGDVAGATRTLLDVFGGNYRSAEVLQAMQTAPNHPGVLTEMGTETATWATVKANPGLTGSFMWTGVDYLGEADGAWPTMGASLGILDAMGTPKNIAFSWQTTWGLSKTSFSTGAVAGKVVLTADHTNITTDLNDAAFVKAAVPTATAAVSFAISGPGTIIAVDSGSQTQESFRGNTRNAYGGLAFAIVQATGPGTITVTATSSGLTAGTATIQAVEGAFVPCSGSCD